MREYTQESKYNVCICLYAVRHLIADLTDVLNKFYLYTRVGYYSYRFDSTDSVYINMVFIFINKERPRYFEQRFTYRSLCCSLVQRPEYFF